LCRAYLVFQVLGVCVAFSRTVWATFTVRWCVHGVHCELEKSSLHPSPMTVVSWVAFIFGWSYFGVIFVSPNIVKAGSCDINVAYI